MPAAGARSLTGNPVELDHDVTELRPAAVQLPPIHTPPAAAGAERQHHHRPDIAPCARMKLAVGRRVRVVLDPDRHGEPVLHARAEIEALERDVDRALDASRLLVETRRNPEA